MADFLSALRSGRVLLMDGAMGTRLLRAGLSPEDGFELYNLKDPHKVRGVHQAYANVGAEVLLTNTFQVVHASIGWQSRPVFPATHYPEDRALIALQWSACTLARSVAPAAFVLADIGSYVAQSTGEEFSDFSMLQHAVKALPPVDGLLLETCSSPRVRLAVRRVVKLRPDLPVLVSMTYRRTRAGSLETLSGHAPEWFAEKLPPTGIAALGVNCGREIGMEDVTEIVRRYRAVTGLPLFARPNAGTPRQGRRRLIYPHTPAKMARRLPALLEAGVNMVGGCCGTGPEHIWAFRPVVQAWNARRR